MDQPRNPRYVTELAAIHFDGMDGLLQVFAQVLGIQKTTPILHCPVWVLLTENMDPIVIEGHGETHL